jgi:hypothetical protein
VAFAVTTAYFALLAFGGFAAVERMLQILSQP